MRRTSPFTPIVPIFIGIAPRVRSTRHIPARSPASRGPHRSPERLPPHPIPPSLAAETARTLVQLVGFGTLATRQGDDAPLGTFVSFVPDKQGLPVMRLRADAMHTVNLQKDARCSVFVQPPNHPARSVARVTLIGRAVQVPAEEAVAYRDAHVARHGMGLGVDAASESDQFWRLDVEKAFHVGGLGSNAMPETISMEEYLAATPDDLQVRLSKEITEHGARITDHGSRSKRMINGVKYAGHLNY